MSAPPECTYRRTVTPVIRIYHTAQPTTLDQISRHVTHARPITNFMMNRENALRLSSIVCKETQLIINSVVVVTILISLPIMGGTVIVL